MKISISKRAVKELKRLPKIDQIAIAKKIRELKNIDLSKVEKLSGYQDIFRVRVGDYRIVYRKTKNEIFIILIRHRKDVYRIIKEIFK